MPPELATLSAGVNPVAPLIHHTEEHGIPIALPRGIDEEEKEAAIRYGTYVSANSEAYFINAELVKQVQAGHVTISPLEAVNYLHNMWLSPVAVIPQVGRMPRLIFDFTWSELNDVSKRLAPMETMRFGGALQRILKQVLTADPCIRPVFFSKVDFTDAYMKL